MPTITLLIDSLGSGGAQRQLMELARELPHFGWRVRIRWYNATDTFTALPEGADGVAIERSGLRDVGFARRVHKELGRKNTDIVHAFLAMPSLYAALNRQLGGAPVVTGVRCSAAAFDDHALDATAYTLAAQWSDHVAVNAQDVGPWMQAHGVSSERITYAPNLLRRDVLDAKPLVASDRAEILASYQIPPGTPPILLVGRFDEYKNQDGLLRAVAALRSEGVAVPPVLMIGRATDPSRVTTLKEMAAQPGMPSVHFGEPTARILDVMQASKFVVLTSHSEGTPNVLLEAVGLGCVAVGVPVGQVAEVLDQGRAGIVATDGSDVSIARAIKTALAMDAAEVQQLQSRARAWARQQFSPRSIAARHDQLYREVLAQRVPVVRRPIRAIVQAAKVWRAARR